MKVKFEMLQQSRKGNKFSVCGLVSVACELVKDNVPVGHGMGKIVRLLEKGGGYPCGHIITVGNSEIEN